MVCFNYGVDGGVFVYGLFWEGVANQMAVQAQLQPVASQPVFDFSDPVIDVDIMTTSEMS